ncbi:MAG: amidase family protein [Cyanophyceae cyanobacterium]
MWRKFYESLGKSYYDESVSLELAERIVFDLLSQNVQRGDLKKPTIADVLGKANLTEFANFVAFDRPNGFSTSGGRTLTPYSPGPVDVGGSSSGSAAAVAANLLLAISNFLR